MTKNPHTHLVPPSRATNRSSVRKDPHHDHLRGLPEGPDRLVLRPLWPAAVPGGDGHAPGDVGDQPAGVALGVAVRRHSGVWCSWSPSFRSTAARPPGGCAAAAAYAVGGLARWTSFRAKASQGQLADEEALEDPDLPGVLQGVQIHDGPPHGSQLRKVAVIQDHATKTWAVTASVVHPGIGMDDVAARDRYGEALAGLLDVAGRTEKIDEILIMVRTVPEDGAERELWVQRHRRSDAPPLADQINTDLAHGLTRPRCAPNSSSPSWSPRHGSRSRPRSPAAGSRAAAASCTC